MKHRCGFTLIELLVVLAIAGVLAALAYPSYANYVRQSRRTEGKVALLDTMQHEERYYADYNRYQLFSADAGGEDSARLRWWSGRSPRESAYEISAHACPGEPSTHCVELHAVPGTGRVDGRFRDPECGTLILDSAGRHSASGEGRRCWP